MPIRTLGKGPVTRRFASKIASCEDSRTQNRNGIDRVLDSSTNPASTSTQRGTILTPDPSPSKPLQGIKALIKSLTIVKGDPGVFELSVIGMPSPMDECDNVMNIDHTVNDGLKRKLDGASDELSFPCKKVAISPVKPTMPDPHITTTTPTLAAPKLSKAERDAQKAEKAKERELERLKKEQEKLKREEEKRKKDEEKQKREQEREEEKQKREDERLKKVFLSVTWINR
jgi:hypothetical protein